MSAPDEAAPPPPRAADGVHVWQGLLWREWLVLRGLFIPALAVWLGGLWVLVLFIHPGFILAFGVLYAILAGPMLGGADAAEGSEEFAFALPPTRGQRYLARALLGLATVLLFTVLGVLAIALDLPQTLWRVVVNSGFTEPFPACEAPCVYPLAVAVPVGVFAFAFRIAADAHGPGLVRVAWLLACVVTALLLGAGFYAERALWRGLNGYVSATALLAAAPLALLAGSAAYRRKEGTSRPAPLRSRSLWWLWLLVLLPILVVLALVLLYRALSYSEHSESRPRERTAPAMTPARRDLRTSVTPPRGSTRAPGKGR